MPGRTPTAVPSSTPRAEYIRLVGVSALPNPSIRRLSESMSEHPVQDPGRDGDPEADVEAVPGAHRQQDTDDQVQQDPPAAQDVRRAGEQHGPGDRPAEEIDERDVEHEDTGELGDRRP